MEKGFQHISVVPDEDEIVIQAGVRPAAQAADPVAVEPEAAVEAAAEVPAEALEVAAEEAPQQSAEDAKAEEQLAAVESGAHNLSWALHAAIAEERAENPRPERTGYRETTLEDLQGTPMSKQQKTILIVLAAFALVFALYCVLRFGVQLF